VKVVGALFSPPRRIMGGTVKDMRRRVLIKKRFIRRRRLADVARSAAVVNALTSTEKVLSRLAPKGIE
jgi:hypothetical protein